MNGLKGLVIMKISSINNIKLNYMNKTVNSTLSNINKNIGLKDLYPANYTNYISFGAKARTNQEKLDFIGKDNFPNQQILDSFKQVIDNDEDKKLYEIHEEYYADLLECKTLNEAKKRYPEFEDVLDAKDVDDNRPHSLLNKVKNGEKEGLCIDDLSLKLLQAHYAKRVGVYADKKFYDFNSGSMRSLFLKLNIKELPKKYMQVMFAETPNFFDGRCDVIKNYWKTAEKRAELSEKHRNYYKQTTAWKSNQDKNYLNSSRKKLKLLASYSESLSTALKINNEFRKKFGDLIEESKDFKVIVYKLDLKEPIIDEDREIIDNFFANAQKEMKNYSWVLGEMRKEILVGLGFEVKGNSDEN